MDAGSSSTEQGASASWLVRLNVAGAEGWELVAQRVLNLQYGNVQYAGTFRRPLTAERLAAIQAEKEARANAPTPARREALDALVAEGRISREDAEQFVVNGRVTDEAWETIQRLRQ